MSFAFLVYLISVVPKIAVFISSASLTGITLYLGRCLFTAMHNNSYGVRCNDVPKDTYPRKLWVILPLAGFLFTTLIPSEKQLYVIAGAYVAEKAYTSEIGQDAVKLIHYKIEEQIGEFIDKAEKSTK